MFYITSFKNCQADIEGFSCFPSENSSFKVLPEVVAQVISRFYSKLYLKISKIFTKIFKLQKISPKFLIYSSIYKDFHLFLYLNSFFLGFLLVNQDFEAFTNFLKTYFSNLNCEKFFWIVFNICIIIQIISIWLKVIKVVKSL